MRLHLMILPAILALGLGAQAGHCESYSTSAAELQAGEDCSSREESSRDAQNCAIPNKYYVDIVDADCPLECTPWVYQESNDLYGLQRQDFSVDDTCHFSIFPDTRIF